MASTTGLLPDFSGFTGTMGGYTAVVERGAPTLVSTGGAISPTLEPTTITGMPMMQTMVGRSSNRSPSRIRASSPEMFAQPMTTRLMNTASQPLVPMAPMAPQFNLTGNVDITRLNSALQTSFATIQAEIQQLSIAVLEERRARQTMELVIQEVRGCKEICAASELALMEERQHRMQMQVDFQARVQGLANEVALCKDREMQTEKALMDERRERQQMQANFQTQLQAVAAELVSGKERDVAIETALMEERRERQQMDAHLEAQIQGIMGEINAIRARMDRTDNPPENPIRAAVRVIESRGRLRISAETGAVTLLQPVAFHPRTTKDEPTAELKDVVLADAVCRDLAELSNIFNCPMTIEGHTRGGESDFWQTLANARSAIIAEKMVQFGANPTLLTTRGLPGRLGKNEVKTEIYMDVGRLGLGTEWMPK